MNIDGNPNSKPIIIDGSTPVVIKPEAEVKEDPKDALKKVLKSFRLDVDGIYQIVRSLKPMQSTPTSFSPYKEFNSPELIDAENFLRYAKGWAGKLLGELGDETPYKNDGKRKAVSDIEPTDSRNTETPFAKISNGSYQLPNGHKVNIGLSHTERVDKLRTIVEELANVIRKLDHGFHLDTREKSSCRTNIWTCLVNARMSLGFEMERYKEEQTYIMSRGVQG